MFRLLKLCQQGGSGGVPVVSPWDFVSSPASPGTVEHQILARPQQTVLQPVIR